MSQDAVLVRFPGDPDLLLPRYAEGLRRFRAAQPEVVPHVAFAGRSDEHPDALVVILLWPAGTGHAALGGFLMPLLRELGLERPQVEHLKVGVPSWEAIAATRAVAS